MSQTFSDRMFDGSGDFEADGPPILSDDSPLADSLTEPPLTGWLDDDMRQIQQRLEECEARLGQFDLVVAGRLGGVTLLEEDDNPRASQPPTRRSVGTVRNNTARLRWSRSRTGSRPR